ncbi:MAG: flagellar hook-basal body complex protein FliE [Candidatus Competibacter denitrificans]
MTAIDTTHTLTTGLRSTATSTSSLSAATSAGADESADFAETLKAMLANVNGSQQRATGLAESFEAGQEQDLAGVMVAQQQARLTFQTALQVRNKLVSAYQDIMNMPI